MIMEHIDSVKKSKIKIHLPSINSESLLLGILLATVGGFLDAYTYIGRGGVFANAQTGNLVLVAIETVNKNYRQALIQALPIFAFIVGIMVFETIKKNSYIFFIGHPERFILVVEIVILFFVGFVPSGALNTIATVTISFVTSLQFASFKKLVDSPYATTMCTGNLRSASIATYTAFTKKDHKSAIKSLRYFAIVLSFLLGAFCGGFLTSFIGPHAVWASDILLIFSLILLHIENVKMTSH